MDAAIILKLVHVLSAFWFVAGLLGRGLALTQAAKTADVHMANTPVQLGGRFERLMVIPGSSVVFLVGLVTAWAQGWPVLGFLQGGSSNWLLVSIVLFLSLVPVTIWIFLPRGKIFEQALADSVAQGKVTPELTAAFRDQAVAWAHRYELVVVAIIIVLMVSKPF